MASHRFLGLLLSAAASLFIAGCGGGSAAGSEPPPANPGPGDSPTPVLTQFAALGSSARTVTLAWAPATTAAAATTVRIERQSDGGGFTPVATVDARSGHFLDGGLSRDTAYRYRVVGTDAAHTPLAEAQARTTDEDAVVSAQGAAVGAASVVQVGAAGGRLASADGRIAVDLPAGAYAADTAATLQAVANTAPDGRGDGLRLRLAARPALPLRLTLKTDDVPAGAVDGLRIALQQGDGSWLSLPLAAADRAAGTISAELPPGWLPQAAAASTLRVGTDEVDVSIEFTIVKYLAFQLTPKTASVKVGDSVALVPQARVRGYEIEISSCQRADEIIELCFPHPVLETRDVPFLNAKPGYDRQWLVFLDEGGNASHGTVAATGAVGARYTAPAVVPEPATVTVSFVSTHTASGRSVVLSSAITVVDERWQGHITMNDGPSIAGTSVKVTANLAWNLDTAASSGTKKVYRPVGTLRLDITDDDCTVTVSPAEAPVETDTRLVALEIDEATSRYTLRLISFWTATITAVCPKASDTQTTQVAGYGWELSGDLSADGRTIQGLDMSQETAVTEWLFTRP